MNTYRNFSLFLMLAIVALAVACVSNKPTSSPPSENVSVRGGYSAPPELLDAHPAGYLKLAAELWSAGKRNEALFWYYVGQLRYRFHLLANPNLNLSGDPALFASLQSVVGAPINTYAGSDPELWRQTIESVLEWDAENLNGFTSKEKFEGELQTIRSGLSELGKKIQTNANEIRRDRKQHGIGFIGMRDGVYVEERRERMPTDWPELQASTTLPDLKGVYEAVFGLHSTLFFSDQYKVLHATSFELIPNDPKHLLVIARKDGIELKRKTIKVSLQGDALVFQEKRTPAQVGLATGDSTVTYHMRKNVMGDLVIQRDVYEVGQPKNPRKAPVELTYTFWKRAPLIASE